VTAPLRAFRQIRSGEDVIHLAVRLGLLAFLVYWSFILVRPFVPILAWSAVLAVAFYPAFDWLSIHLGGRPKLAATFITVLCLAIIIGPVAWLGVGLVDSLMEISEQFGNGRFVVPPPPAGLGDWPVVGDLLHDLWSKASNNLEAAFQQLAPYLKPVAGYLLAFAGGLGVGALKFLLSVILAGFLFPSGPRLVAASKGFLAHVVAQRSESFLALAGATIRSISQGVIGIAIFQALVIGLGLKLAGVPHASVLSFAVLIHAGVPGREHSADDMGYDHGGSIRWLKNVVRPGSMVPWRRLATCNRGRDATARLRAPILSPGAFDLDQ
jgi:predicted PurR-regulated permease PerM